MYGQTSSSGFGSQPSSTWGGQPQQQQSQSWGGQQPQPYNNTMGGGMQTQSSMGGYNNSQYGGNQQYGGGYGQQQAPGCCPQQQGPQGGGCPADPTAPLCPSGEQSTCYACEQQCDAAVWLAIFLFFVSVIGFGLVVGLNSRDDIFRLYDGDRTSVNLDRAMHWDLVENNRTIPYANWTEAPGPHVPTCPPCPSCDTPAPASPPVTPRPASVTPAPNNTTTATSVHNRFLLQTPGPTWPPVVAEECHYNDRLVGSYGALCMPSTLEATPVLMNISRWVVFRNTLYFLAMMGTLVTLIVVYMVHRTKHPMNQPAQYNQGGIPMSPPIEFNGTPLYHVFRACWFVSGLMVFFWICTEMYQYWWFIGYYMNSTKGPLHDFWWKFDRKFVTTVVFAGLYLCWPLVNMILELVFFIVLFLPWYGYRMCCAPTLEGVRPPPEMELHEVPCCVRMDMFFSECNQLKHCGFSTKLWEMISGTRVGFCDEYLNCGQQFGQQQGFNQTQGMGNSGSGMGMGMGSTQGSMGMTNTMNQQAPPRPGAMGTEMIPRSNSVVMQPAASSPNNSAMRQSMGNVNQSTASFAGQQSVSGSFVAEDSPSKMKKKKKHHSDSDNEDAKEKKKKKKEKKDKDKK